MFKHFEWGGSENKQRRYVEINVWMSTHVRLFAHTRAHMCVHERDGESERGKEFLIFFKNVANSAILPPPTRLAAKMSAGEFV